MSAYSTLMERASMMYRRTSSPVARASSSAGNLAFSEWPKVLGGDEKLTAALLDRPTDHASIITTKGGE
jgi:hypothetical protein